jgi:ubiquinone/menaquinone biosynthesis C-methylase UbiE
MDRKELERQHYDAWALRLDATYDWRSGAQRVNTALRSPYLYCEQWLADRCRGRRVLDFGCGHGIYSVFPAQAGATVVGMDLSPESIRVATERARREGIQDSATFLVGDCEALPFGDDEFDIVLSSAVLHCLDLDKAYSEMARVLQPDGQVLVVETLGHNPVLNLNRWQLYLRGIRTKQALENILEVEDFRHAGQYFNRVDLQFYNLATLVAAPFTKRDSPLADTTVNLLEAVDEGLLRVPWVQKYAFKAVAVFSEPKKPRRL